MDKYSTFRNGVDPQLTIHLSITYKYRTKHTKWWLLITNEIQLLEIKKTSPSSL